MQSEWRISKQMINDDDWYQCYKLADVQKIDHSGNRIEDYQMYRIRSLAERRCKELNAQDAENGGKP